MIELPCAVPPGPALRPRIAVGEGALGILAGSADESGCVLVVTDENVARTPWPRRTREALAAPHGVPVAVSVLRAGEPFKRVEAVASLWGALEEAGAGRDALVVAVGGGCVTDVAGFAAATWARGVPWVAAPTTLLGMADAALGGKTGVNTEAGKNVAGALHHPVAVAADPACLATLPREKLRDGWAEVVKVAGLGDLALLDELDRDAARLARLESGPLESALARAMRVKLDVVVADPAEAGRREILNWGHTLGHAIETATGHRISHGEAVAIGLVAETRLGETLVPELSGFAARLARILRSFGLPTEAPPDLDRARLEAALRLDKKRRRSVVRVSLPEAPGRHAARPSREVRLDDLLAALDSSRSA